MVLGALNKDAEENKGPEAEASAVAVDYCCPKNELDGEGSTAEEGVNPKSEEAAFVSVEGCWPKSAVLEAAPKPPNEAGDGPRGDAKNAGGLANPPIPEGC